MADPALHVEEYVAEDADAPFVLLVHGVLDSALSFEAAIAQLTPEYTVVTYDRRGWARSAQAEEAASFEDHVDDLLAVMNGRRGTVIGHSYGGGISLVAAARHSDLIASLGVFEPSLAWTDFWPTRQTIDEQRADEVGHFLVGLEGRPRPSKEQRAHDRALLEREILLIERVSLDFDDIAVPCLIGRGGLSAQWRYDITDRLSEELGADTMVVEGAGHTAHRAQPQGFANFARRAVALGRSAT